MAWEEGRVDRAWKVISLAQRDRPIGKEPAKGDRYVRSESPPLIDGQLGDTTQQGPEPVNPEGSVDISNVDYREVERNRRPPG